MSEALLDTARQGDVATVSHGVNQISEPDRRRLAPRALRLLREVREAYVGRVGDKPWPYAGDVESVLHATQTLVLRTATPAQPRKACAWGLPPKDIAIET